MQDVQQYVTDANYGNNYKNSFVRHWLTDTFYIDAFSLDSTIVKTKTVDNSAATTASTTNPYACENTQDKVYLLSYQDYNNDAYFPGETGARCKVTDWAIASGAYFSTTEEIKFNGSYWTRSPHAEGSGNAYYVGPYGGAFSTNVDSDSTAVRPAITIEIVD